MIASHSSARALSDVPAQPDRRSAPRHRPQRRRRERQLLLALHRLPLSRRASSTSRRRSRRSRRRSRRRRGPGAPRPARLAALRDSLAAAIPPTPFSSVLIDHIDHIATVAGVDHVGLGSDFDGVARCRSGMEDVTRLPRIAQALLDRGYSDDDVKKMLGGNMLRVMGRVLDVAHAARIPERGG